MLARTVILRDECGKRVAEVLHRHVRECVNLHRRRKRRHYRRTEAIHKPLHHQNAEVHHGLLHASQNGIPGDLSDTARADGRTAAQRAQLRTFGERVDHDADAGNILRDNRGCRRTRNAKVEADDEPQVERDIQNRRDRQKHERHDRITHRAQIRREVII